MYRTTTELVHGKWGLMVLGSSAFAVLWVTLLSSRPVDLHSSGVAVWWTLLCAVSVINVCGWRWSAEALERRRSTLEPALYVFQRRQLLLSLVYVLGCGFRAILPRADVQRLGLYDSWASSVLIGRSVATVAELCFVCQWALFLNRMCRVTHCHSGVLISWLLVPLIFVAELCSWSAVLTTSYLGNAAEESIWTFTASLVVVSCLLLWRRCSSGNRQLLAMAIVLGVAYVAFMCTVDVPMYVSRWLEDQAAGRQYLSLSQGLEDVWSRRYVSFSWEEWHTEMPWMTLYFSVAVWCSISLVHVRAAIRT